MDNERKSYQLVGVGTNLLAVAQGDGLQEGSIKEYKEGSYRFFVLFPAKFPTKAVGDALKPPRRHDRP
ncbi:Uncharacterised protein [Corynebacterium ulcerans]|nr:Uncharacterised protein [Corynebacterium ulcerans]